jgi:hypothetical protein
MRAIVLLALVVGVSAHAHTLSAEEVVASLASPAARVATGVERVAPSPANERVLVVQVGRRWYDLPVEDRAATAGEWRDLWRHAMPSGVVAVLDARTGSPVVRFAPGGVVAAVRAAAGSDDGPPAPQGRGMMPADSR